MRSTRTAVVLALVGAVLVLPSVASAAAVSTGARADQGESGRIVDRINVARGAHGLSPLRPSATLARSSERFADHLMGAQLFGHAPRIQASSRFRVLGEVLALHRGRAGRPGATVRRWLQSPPHRALILGSSFGLAGGATGRGRFRGRPSVIWVVQLGSI